MFSLLFFLQSVIIVVCFLKKRFSLLFFYKVFSLLFFFKKRFSLLFFYKVFSLLVFLTKCSHWFFYKVFSLLFFLLQSVLIDLFLFFTKFFVCFYDIKNNYTRKCCARNSWFFSTILHFYHIRPSTNFWLFVCCNPTD